MADSAIMMYARGQPQPLSFGLAREQGLLLTSQATSWAGVPFELHQTMPAGCVVPTRPIPGEHQLRVIVDGELQVWVHFQGRRFCWRARPGTMTLHSGPGPTSERVTGSSKVLVASLSPPWLERMQHEGLTLPDGIHCARDANPVARSLAEAMCNEVSDGAPTGTLFAESLSMALLSYALDGVPLSRMQVGGGLSDAQCRKLKRYIEERLTQNLRLSDLAGLCGLSSRHFTTVFRRAFGVPPHRYVLQRRLSLAANLLLTTPHEIAEIAMRTGFSSQSHFTTAFRRAYGVTPARYAMRGRRVAQVADDLDA